MAAIASITVKKYDGTTDIIFDALVGAGGDSSPALWRQDSGNAAGLPSGLRSFLRLGSSWNGPKTARQMRFNIAFPYATQDSTTTLYAAKDRVVWDGIVTIPAAIPLAWVQEAIAQGTNLIANGSVFRPSMIAGYAPT